MSYAQIKLYTQEIHLHKVIASDLMLLCWIKAHDSLLDHFIAARVHLKALLGHLKRLLAQIILISCLDSFEVLGRLLARKTSLLR